MGPQESFDKYAKEYDAWYEKYKPAFESELLALRAFLPENPEKLKALEIGVGTGRFASALGIGIGLDPSRAMARLAKQHGLEVVLGVAEFLPFKREQFDLILIVTALEFFETPEQAFREALRVLEPGGQILAGILDRDSLQDSGIESGHKKGRIHLKKGRFSSGAHFFSSAEVSEYLAEAGFTGLETCQALFKPPEEIKEIEIPEKGHGEGLLSVISARKPL